MVEKRRRYYAPLLLIVIYTLALYLCIDMEVKRQQAELSRAYWRDVSLEENRWQSPSWGIIDNIKHLGLLGLECYISPYDNLFRKYSEIYGTDWRMMSAIAYCESRFMPYVISYSGATGLMQIMPRTGRIYGFDEESLSDPEVNVRVANIHLNDIERMLRLPDEVSYIDRMSLILASYNGGIGHLFDAQRLCRAMGEDPNKWDNVSRQLRNLRYAEYYERPEVRVGAFRAASYTLRYVKDVMLFYDIYCEQSADFTHHLLPYSRGEYMPFTQF